MRRQLLTVMTFTALIFGVAAPAFAQDCRKDFDDLIATRTSVIGSLNTLGAANKKSPSVENAKKACSLLGDLVSADEKVNGWVGENGAWCAIPEDVQGQMAAALKNSTAERTTTCNIVKKLGTGPVQQPGGGACQTKFNDLAKSRLNVIGQLNGIGKQQKKNPTPDRVIKACSLLNTLVAREDALLGWISKNQKSCGIPAKLKSQIAQAGGASRKSRGETCAIAAKIKSGEGLAPPGSQPSGPASQLPGGGVRLPSGAL